MQLATGGDPTRREDLVGPPSKLLADSHTLDLKTQNFPWNVIGPMFQTLPLMFEPQYDELALSVDLLVEPTRSLGRHPAPASYVAFGRLSSVPDTDGVDAPQPARRVS